MFIKASSSRDNLSQTITTEHKVGRAARYGSRLYGLLVIIYGSNNIFLKSYLLAYLWEYY